jgi:type III restriction enzyme
VIDLFDFQQAASHSIVQRYLQYAADPVVIGTRQSPRVVPFFQVLSSITASGKTVILADAVAGIAVTLPVKPVILWLSKGKVTVEQTFANLMPGGKYNHLLQGAEVRALGDFLADELAASSETFVYIATVGTFNQKDKEAGSLSIYRSDIDNADGPIWLKLQERLDGQGVQRPLFVVYDEAHNLSNQQTELLMEQKPDGFLLASATMRMPGKLESLVHSLRANGYDDAWLMTAVNSAAVAESGLVKSTIVLSGYRTPMEEAVTQLLTDMGEAESDAVAYGLSGMPKAMYVCQTNITEGNSNQLDNIKRPFGQRQAPPILIWRFLTEQKNVDPESIAVYCSLRFDKNFPPPDEFHLFGGGDQDYDEFVSGNYRHIIFNLSLQEGWDDPMCYFAYIDKSMESRVQIEQIVGRLLRQPNATQLASERLNAAHFYVRVDNNEAFADVLDHLNKKLSDDAPQIRFISSSPGSRRPLELPCRSDAQLPGTALDASAAVDPISSLLGSMNDYRFDTGVNTQAAGGRSVVRKKVGTSASGDVKWEEYQTSSEVMARWLFTREVRRIDQRALDVAPTTEDKFDALIGIGSNADHHVTDTARKAVRAYLDEVCILQKRVDYYKVGPVIVRPDSLVRFNHSVHEGYDDLNPLELEFAQVLDSTGLIWCRNPSRSGYSLPLIAPGPTKRFFPDFIAWEGRRVFLIETKGEHLLAEAAARKLLNIQVHPSSEMELTVRFVSQGKWSSDVSRQSGEGYTVWGFGSNGERRVWHAASMADVAHRIFQ